MLQGILSAIAAKLQYHGMKATKYFPSAHASMLKKKDSLATILYSPVKRLRIRQDFALTADLNPCV